MKIELLGADREVTGSCHYVTFGETHFLVDCGMEQGPDLYVNQEIPVNAATIDYVFVTHAHIDHSGLLPLLYSHGFRGKVFATKATCELCNIMLKDSDKSKGVESVLEFFGLAPDQAMSFGDGENDVEMLHYTGIGVAMGNGKKVAQKAADFVTADIDEDGWAKACLRYGLIDEIRP